MQKILITNLLIGAAIVATQAQPSYAATTLTITSLTPANNGTVTITGTQQVVTASANGSITTDENSYSVNQKLAYEYQGEPWGSISDITTAYPEDTTPLPLSFGYTLYKLTYDVKYSLEAIAPAPAPPTPLKKDQTNTFHVQ